MIKPGHVNRYRFNWHRYWWAVLFVQPQMQILSYIENKGKCTLLKQNEYTQWTNIKIFEKYVTGWYENNKFWLTMWLVFHKIFTCKVVCKIATLMLRLKCVSCPLLLAYCTTYITAEFNNNYRKTSNISRILVGNKIVDNSDVVGASPVGAAPTTSSFST